MCGVQPGKILQVLVQCDNQGAAVVVNSDYSKVQAIMHAHLLHCLFFIQAWFNFYLRAVYIPSECNVLADMILRDNLDIFFL